MINNQVDNSGTMSSTISNDVVNPFEDDTPGDGVYYCNQSSNGITTNFVNTAYPSFNSKQVSFFYEALYFLKLLIFFKKSSNFLVKCRLTVVKRKKNKYVLDCPRACASPISVL